MSMYEFFIKQNLYPGAFEYEISLTAQGYSSGMAVAAFLLA